jgi:hypothetical protein
MTDGLDQALAGGGLALLAADVQLVTYDGAVPSNPTPPPPYVVVYTTVEWPAEAEGDALDALSGSPTVRWICHCVGGDAKASRAVVQRVRTQLLNKRLVVAGLDVGLIKLEPGVAPPQRDETTGALVMDTVVTFRAYATS